MEHVQWIQMRVLANHENHLHMSALEFGVHVTGNGLHVCFHHVTLAGVPELSSVLSLWL